MPQSIIHKSNQLKQNLSMKILSIRHLATVLALAHVVRAAPPDAKMIGEAFGFPPDQLVISDVLAQEKEIYSIQTSRESREGQAPPVRPEDLLAAYRITGRVKNTFFPVLLTVAKGGSFLAGDVLETIKQLEAYAVETEKSDGNKPSFGIFTTDSSSLGGIFLGKLLMPSRFQQESEPQLHMAIICELRFENEGVDVRMAQRKAFDGEVRHDLISAPGGETYFKAFGPREPYDESPRERASFDYKACFAALNRTLVENYFKDHPSPEPPAAERSAPTAVVKPPFDPLNPFNSSDPPQPATGQPAPAPTSAPASTPIPPLHRAVWAVLVVLATLAGWFVLKTRAKRE
jgi:hypothetical protein